MLVNLFRMISHVAIIGLSAVCVMPLATASNKWLVLDPPFQLKMGRSLTKVNFQSYQIIML